VWIIAANLLSIQVGRTAPLGPERVPSAFRKQRAEGPVAVGRLGLGGDEQADLAVHGGPEKAVYAYADEHYTAWSEEFPDHREQFVAGGFGENLTVAGMLERDLCVGDVHRIGSALLQVCQPRQPCFKLALFFDDSRLAKAMVRSGRAGWYYRVLEEGEIQASDELRLEERPHPDFSFERLIEIVNFGKASPDELRAMASMTGLASRLRARAGSALSGLQP
jgi:MOSC domain-containing protein YiiM